MRLSHVAAGVAFAGYAGFYAVVNGLTFSSAIPVPHQHLSALGKGLGP